MKKVLFGVIMIAMIAAMVAAGTWAYFSDYETSCDNYFGAGVLDLKVDGADDPLPVYFEETCLAPCWDEVYEIVLSNVGCVPGKLNIKLFNLVDNDNGCSEPEADVDTTCGDPGAGEGELSQNMLVEILADCDDSGDYETLVAEGTVFDIADIDFYFCDCISTPEGETDITEVPIVVHFWIPCEVGNIIQSDSISFCVEFSLEQEPCMGECALEVTGFDQPEGVVMPGPYNFDVLVHATGDMACSGWINVAIEDGAGGTVWTGSRYVADLAPCDTVALPFSWTPTAPGSYVVVADGARCPFEVMEPGALVVTGIQQPDYLQICENLSVGVDVHNQGGVPAEGNVLVAVVDPDGNPLAIPQFIPTGLIDPCQTVKIAVDFGHVGESWRPGGAVVAGFPANPMDPQPEEMFICPMGFFMPATFEVTGIQQPAGAQPCEQVDIAVDIHNIGDKPGVTVVEAWIEDAGGLLLWGPVQVQTDVVNPCETVKVPVGTVHILEDWLGQTVYVVADAGLADPFVCTINVLGASCIVVTGIQQPATVEVCDILEVAIDVHNAGGKPGDCWYEWWLTDESGQPLGPAGGGPVPLLNPCETAKIPVLIGHAGTDFPPLPVVVVWAVSCCGDPFPCPINVVEPFPESATYYTDPATSWMALWSSIGGAAAEPPSPTPFTAKFDVLYGPEQSGSVYRDLTIPYGSWDAVAYCAGEMVPMLNYVTINVEWNGSTDGDGRLYFEGGDVDLDVDIIDQGNPVPPPPGSPDFIQQVTIGDGAVDPAGSAWMRLFILAKVYSNSVAPADPCNPASWGALVLPVPLDLYMTTATAQCHIQDLVNPGYPHVALNCHTVPDAAGSPMVPLAGTPFAAPYGGTDGAVAGATGGIDYIVLGFVELDFQVELYWDLSTTPWDDPCD